MNINLARKADFWIGVPLCWFFSACNALLKLIRPEYNRNAVVKKVLFIKLSELGAVILSYPLMNRVKKMYPDSELFFATFKGNKDVFKILGGVIPEENILEIRQEPALLILDAIRAVGRLRREKINIVFDLEFFARFSALFSYFTGAIKRIGFYRYSFEGLYRGQLLTHKIQYNPLSHVTKNYLSLCQAAEQEEKDAPQLYENIDDAEVFFHKYVSDYRIKERVLLKLRNLGVEAGEKNSRIFLVNPGEGVLPLREWPIENFIELSNLILAEKENRVVIIGTQGVGPKADFMLKNINNPRCVSMASQTELDELIEIFSISDALISNDCGLAHMAMLSSISKFIIFGPESPQIFGPLAENSNIIYSRWPCSPCLSVLNHRNSLCRDNRCLKTVEPEYVYDLVIKSLRRKTIS